MLEKVIICEGCGANLTEEKMNETLCPFCGEVAENADNSSPKPAQLINEIVGSNFMSKIGINMVLLPTLESYGLSKSQINFYALVKGYGSNKAASNGTFIVVTTAGAVLASDKGAFFFDLPTEEFIKEVNKMLEYGPSEYYGHYNGTILKNPNKSSQAFNIAVQIWDNNRESNHKSKSIEISERNSDTSKITLENLVDVIVSSGKTLVSSLNRDFKQQFISRNLLNEEIKFFVMMEVAKAPGSYICSFVFSEFAWYGVWSLVNTDMKGPYDFEYFSKSKDTGKNFRNLLLENINSKSLSLFSFYAVLNGKRLLLQEKKLVIDAFEEAVKMSKKGIMGFLSKR